MNGKLFFWSCALNGKIHKENGINGFGGMDGFGNIGKLNGLYTPVRGIGFAVLDLVGRGLAVAESHMDAVRDFLTEMLQKGRVKGHFWGLLNILIGRRISRADGTVLSTGITWRALANLLKQCHYDAELVRELGMDPDAVGQRDRQRFWYAVIGKADVASEEATKQGDKLAALIQKDGYVIGPAPGTK
jgi:hypothetical protein